MYNLHTDICYSPGQDLSNDVFGLALQQSFNFLISRTFQAISGVVSESTSVGVYEMKLFGCLFLTL